MICFVIGKGSIGNRHAANLKEIGLDIIHYSWRDITIKSLRESLIKNKGSSCVIIATATSVRLEIIDLCAELDIPMYIEKPIGYKKNDLQKIFSISKNLQKRSFVGFMMRYHPLVQYLTKIDFKNIYRINIEIGHDVNQWRPLWNFSESYASNKEGGGVLLDLCHEIDIAYLLSSDLKVENISCFQAKNFDEVDVLSSINLSSTKGVLCNISMDYLAPTLIRRGALISQKKNIYYDLVASSTKEITEKETIEKNFSFNRNQMFIDAMKDFINIASGNNSSNPISPSLYSVHDTCYLIADAWEKRKFIGYIETKLK